VAEEDGVSIPDFYKGIASLDKTHPVLFRFPGSFALLLVRLTEFLGIRLPITTDNLLGLKHLRHFPNHSAEDLGIRVRTFSDSIRELSNLSYAERPPIIPPQNLKK